MSGFDRSLLHRWEVVKPQSGEWPRVTIAPLCDSRLTRIISPEALADDDVTDPTEEYGVGVCQTCLAIHTTAVAL
jgi:hypothetical protein